MQPRSFLMPIEIFGRDKSKGNKCSYIRISIFISKMLIRDKKLNIVLYLKGGFSFDTVSYSSNKCFFYYSDIERFNIMFLTRDVTSISSWRQSLDFDEQNKSSIHISKFKLIYKSGKCRYPVDWISLPM